MRERRGWLSWATLGLVVSAVLMCLEVPALARHNFSMLRVKPEVGASGAEVSVSGFSYPVNVKVLIRFNALDGPVLAELEPTANQDISGTVRIPPDTPSGRYVLYAVQSDAAGKPNRIPGRGAVTVTGSSSAPAPVLSGLELEARPSAMIRSGGAAGVSLVLVGLGAFGIAALLSLLMARVAMSRRPPAPVSEEHTS